MPVTLAPAARGLAAALLAGVLALPGSAAAQGFAGAYLAAEHAAMRGDLSAAADYYEKALARDGDNARLMERAMTHQIAAGRLPQGIALARSLDATRPDQHLSMLVLSVDALKRGDAARAAAELETDGDGSTAFVGRIMRAWALFGTGDMDAALAALDELEAGGAGGPAGETLAAYHTGLIEAATGDDADAAEAFARAAEGAGTGNTRIARARAGALARLGRSEEAVGVLDEAVARLLSAPRIAALADEIRAGESPGPTVTDAPGGAEIGRAHV